MHRLEESRSHGVSKMNGEKMISLTEGFRTKADKMRVLEREGVSRADIARFLGVRYQQVRNTLEGDKRTGYDPDLTQTFDENSHSLVAETPKDSFRQLVVLEDENVALPADMIEDLCDEGSELFALRLEDGIFISNSYGMARRARFGLGVFGEWAGQADRKAFDR